MSESDGPLERLCELAGVAGSYYDIGGTRHVLSDAARRRLLESMGHACRTDEEAAASVRSILGRRWRRRLPPVCVLWEGATQLAADLTMPQAESGRALEWRLSEESGRERRGRLRPDELLVTERSDLDGEPWFSATLKLPLPEATGYHRLVLYAADGGEDPLATSLVVFAPGSCHRPESFAAGQRLWGLTAQLYGLRSQRNWGIGDFTDLLRTIEFAADGGADFVGLNPLHAPAGVQNANASPYNPSTRLFLNPLYLDVEAIPEFAGCQRAQRRVANQRFQAALRSLRAAELVDYAAVAELKLPVLELLYAEFRKRHPESEDTERAQAFRAFRREGGDALRRYATFEALQEHFRARNPPAWTWPAWPAPYREWQSAAVGEFADAHEERIEFFCYLQWNAASQLHAAQHRAHTLGMKIGLYADLALSSTWGGADTWSDAPLFAAGAHLGAPPDDFNLKGQDWGLPPWNPEALRDAAYRPFIETLRANMRYGGALRIDHVMSLLRCFWIPAGLSPADGGYVHYGFEEMRAILALESRRNACVVIGEDLGTVPDAVRDGLRAIGALGYRVFYFEKDADGAFKPPGDFDAEALTVISTHDLPTLGGFWAGRDLELRSELALFPSEEMRERQVVARAEDRAKLLVALGKQHLLPAGFDGSDVQHSAMMSPELRCALHAYLARTSSRLVAVQVEDLLGESEQANLPGTTTEYPNWRRRVSLQLESWPEPAAVRELMAVMRRERPAARAAAPRSARRAAAPRAEIPRATYRLQLHFGFRFADAADLAPYLAALGVSHCYCSPYLKARPGSTHGYDIVDHNALNPEIGERADFEAFCEALEGNGLGQILDIVPNHMAVMGRDNAWWLDVLENGPASNYAPFFDIDWHPIKDELRGKVLLPVLGDHYGNVLDHGELKLGFDDDAGSFAVDYYEHRFPLDPREYVLVLKPDIDQLRNRLPEEDPAMIRMESLLTALGNLPPRFILDDDSRAERARDEMLLKERLARLVREAPDIRRYVDECLRSFNGDESYPADTARMHGLLEAQAYRLAYWRVASDEINYRRFFDINELASLRMENSDVFEATHRLILELVAQGKLQGLRIDHPDGLYDPRGYFERLQRRIGDVIGRQSAAEEPPLYLLAEKILASDERLREDWPIHGTTGYDFVNLVGRFLVRDEGLRALETVYFDFIERQVPYTDVLYRSKKLIMQTALASELNVLAAELDRLAEEDPHTRDFGGGGLKSALLETVACFPVYRSYVVGEQIAAADEAVINRAIGAAKRRSEAADTTVFEFLRELLLLRSASGRAPELRERVARFVMKLQQYTAPVAAKGMEDTAFYRYGRLISLNEVGGTPDRPGVSVGDLHEANSERAAEWPHSLLSSSTHDAKRSEDVRARLHVLSELPEKWRARVQAWAHGNAVFKTDADGALLPDRDIEYFFYQTLFGVWPLGALDPAGRSELTERVAGYMSKAVREAKRHTSWINPDPEYEAALDRFVRAVLDTANAEFLEDFAAFQQRAARLGVFNGLTQLALKLTCPGVPDVYQGNELWRFDLVDPDNRRRVDFARRRALLAELRAGFEAAAGSDFIADLVNRMEDGRIKLFVTWRALTLRREHAEVFERGDYEPLRVSGARTEHVCAFARRAGGETLVVAVLRWYADLVDDGARGWSGGALDDTSIELPAAAAGYVDAFSPGSGASRGHAEGGAVPASELFAELPVAIWIAA
jgi:(1->4)-alpha-D-glucan 1-alpha-D-glucosylmutase